MKNSYTEFICDYCGCAEHFICNTKNQIPADQQARNNGWIITRDGKHFDFKECYQNYKAGAPYEFKRDTGIERIQ